MRSIPIGVKNYIKIKNSDYYIVDKSLLIKEFLDRRAEVTLITRPRRFGKTLNMSMMAEFFDITKDSRELFRGTKIMDTEYASQINSYPVIFLTFADAKKEKRKVVSSIKMQLLKLWKYYKFLWNDLDEFDQPVYEMITSEIKDLKSENLIGISDAISFLMDQLYSHYGKKVMVFIDEYDTPFIESRVGGFYEDINNGLASLLHNSLKTSDSLQYALLTGIQRIAKENIFSDLNNPLVCTVVDPEYASYFGFTEDETKELLEYYGFELTQEVKDMYDGYRFGGYEIYNPWSIFNYVSRGILQPYWVNTGSNKMIKEAMSKTNEIFLNDYDKLIQEGNVPVLIDMQSNFYEINTPSSLWGLFVNAGYLTIEETISSVNGKYVVRIPNNEIVEEFKKLTAHYLNISDIVVDKMTDALLHKDEKEFIKYYRKLLLSKPSFHHLKSENSYHMFVLGICLWLHDKYEIKSNSEEGEGRGDIILQSRQKDNTSYVFEFKFTNNKKEDLSSLAKDAVNQIEKNQYAINLTGNVIYVGLAHCIKQVEMQWIEKVV